MTRIHNSFYFAENCGLKDTIKSIFTPKFAKLAGINSHNLSKEKAQNITAASFIIFAISAIIVGLALTALLFSPAAALVPFLAVGALIGIAAGAGFLGILFLYIGCRAAHTLHLAKEKNIPSMPPKPSPEVEPDDGYDTEYSLNLDKDANSEKEYNSDIE
jgi:hypothetical protein